jgi:hypothetical protein
VDLHRAGHVTLLEYAVAVALSLNPFFRRIAVLKAG